VSARHGVEPFVVAETNGTRSERRRCGRFGTIQLGLIVPCGYSGGDEGRARFFEERFGETLVVPAGVTEEDVGDGGTEVVEGCYFGYACVECCGEFVGGEHSTLIGVSGIVCIHFEFVVIAVVVTIVEVIGFIRVRFVIVVVFVLVVVVVVFVFVVLVHIGTIVGVGAAIVVGVHLFYIRIIGTWF